MIRCMDAARMVHALHDMALHAPHGNPSTSPFFPAELLLSEHFAEGIRQLRRRHPELPVRITNFDWHGNIKELKDKGTVEGLWAQLEAIMRAMDMHHGRWEPGQAPEGGAWGCMGVLLHGCAA